MLASQSAISMYQVHLKSGHNKDPVDLLSFRELRMLTFFQRFPWLPTVNR
jgi:hypothetical protein